MFCFAFSVAEIINDSTSPSPSSSWRSWQLPWFVLKLVDVSPVAEKGLDQRKYVCFARTHVSPQHSVETISSTLITHAYGQTQSAAYASVKFDPIVIVVLILLIVQTDRASTLDETVEYFKSLQMQVHG